jgi:hypothetical protein
MNRDLADAVIAPIRLSDLDCLPTADPSNQTPYRLAAGCSACAGRKLWRMEAR